MKFTLVLSSDESRDLSYGLVFIPCPVWVKGMQEILNLNPERPDYRPGSVRRLLEAEGLLLEPAERRCVVVVHPAGNGTEQDLRALLDDLSAEGLPFSVVRL